MDINQVLENFKDLVFKDKTIKGYREAIKSGGTLEDVEEYAKRLAELMVKSLESVPDGTDLVPFLRQLGEEQRKYINSAYEVVQKAMNKAIEVDLNPILAKSMQEVTIDALKKTNTNEMDLLDIVKSLEIPQITQNLKIVDTNIRSNASFQSKNGIQITVSRYYDDIGLRNRTQKCQWCLQRTGVDVPYQEAVNRGMFERHEGCGCKIIYKTNKTLVQTRKGRFE